jgi:hypothetical protein
MKHWREMSEQDEIELHKVKQAVDDILREQLNTAQYRNRYEVKQRKLSKQHIEDIKLRVYRSTEVFKLIEEYLDREIGGRINEQSPNP